MFMSMLFHVPDKPNRPNNLRPNSPALFSFEEHYTNMGINSLFSDLPIISRRSLEESTCWDGKEDSCKSC